MDSTNTTQLFVEQHVAQHDTGIRLSIHLTIPILAFLSAIALYAINRKSIKDISHGKPVNMLRNIPWKDGSGLIASHAYHSDNTGFLQDGFKRLGDIFAFRFRSYKVIAISSEEARKVYYRSKDLNMLEAWTVLKGEGIGAGKMKGIVTIQDSEGYSKILTSLLKTERLQLYLPLMIKDLSRYCNEMEDRGRFNPWDVVYTIIIHLLLRVCTINDFADSQKTVQTFSNLYQEYEYTENFGSIFMPGVTRLASRFPFLKFFFGNAVTDSKEVDRRKEIVKELVDLFKPQLNKRYEESEKRKGKTGAESEATENDEYITDPMQLFVENGWSPVRIMRYMLSTLNGGTINTFKVTCWLIVHILSSPIYKPLVQREVLSVLGSSSAPATESSLSRLSQIQLEALETKMPVLDSCIRETIRMYLNGSTVRMNVSAKDVVLQVGKNGEQYVVAPGEYLTLSTKYVHYNENIYSSPEKWDPTRFSRYEDDKEQFAFVGWGGGRHRCSGKRLAELEFKLIITFLLTQYPNCSLEFEDGTTIDSEEKVPKVREKSHKTFLPPDKPVYVRCDNQ